MTADPQSRSVKITVDQHGLTYVTEGFPSILEALGAVQACASIMVREAYPPVAAKEPFVRVRP